MDTKETTSSIARHVTVASTVEDIATAVIAPTVVAAAIGRAAATIRPAIKSIHTRIVTVVVRTRIVTVVRSGVIAGIAAALPDRNPITKTGTKKLSSTNRKKIRIRKKPTRSRKLCNFFVKIQQPTV